MTLNSSLQTVCGRSDCPSIKTGASCATSDGTSCGMTNASLFERASKVLVGGVNSPVRAFRSVGGTPYFVARGQGSRVWDVEGREYIDFVQSYGASILGHAHPEVVATIQQAATQGTTFGAPTYREVLMAEAIAARVPGIDGAGKMSKSKENTLDLLESRESLWDKIRVAPTDPARVRRTDPGEPERCTIYSYHKLFSSPDLQRSEEHTSELQSQ